MVQDRERYQIGSLAHPTSYGSKKRSTRKNVSDNLTRGSQEPVIAHLVFNLTSKVDRKWDCYT